LLAESRNDALRRGRRPALSIDDRPLSEVRQAELRVLRKEESGRTTMPARKTPNVLNVRLSRNRQASCFQAPDAKLHTIDGHDFGRLAAEVFHEP